jgi:acetyl-CoA acetyltransferase
VSGVHLLGVGTTSLSRRRRESRSLAREAIAAALADAGVSPREVDGLAIASANVGFDLGCYDVLGRNRRPFRCRCGLGSIALHSGWNAVAAGASEIVVCVGHDSPPPPRRPPSFEAQAATARLYMRHSGATEEHLARVAAKNLSNGAANPRAPEGTPVDAGQVLASEMLAWPLRRLMIAEPAQGAAAVVLGSHEAGRRGGPRSPRIRASVLLDEDAGDGAATAHAARLAYFSAELGPEDVDVAEIDDPTPIEELAAYEALEFAPPGSGPELVESGFTTLSGVVPVNPSGGALAQGRAVGTGGILQMVELALQLKDRAGRRQVPGARVGLGLIGSWEPSGAATTVTILSG